MADKSSIENYQLNFNDVELLIAKFSHLEEMVDALTLPDAELRLYNEPETADILNISYGKLRSLRKAGAITYRQIDKRVLYSRKDILDYHESIAVAKKIKEQ
jgi:hypothetical protein